jgi:hypothetical protein
MLLLQLRHTEHGRLQRYHSGLESRTHACGNGSHDRTALCRGSDCAVSRPLFDSKVRMIPRQAVVIYTGRATNFLL